MRADINGDGTDEVGAFAVEVTGLARGPWYQVHEADGSLLSGVFLNPTFSGYQFRTMDLDGNTSEELVALSSRNSDGATRLEVRGSNGTLLASTFITGVGFSQHQLFPINFNGGAASEIGVGFVRDSDGVGFYHVWRLNGASLVKDVGPAVTGSGFDSHQWSSGDFDGDGNEEVFVGFRRISDSAAVFQVWDPQTLGQVGSAFVPAGPTFTGHKWFVGNFDGSQAGTEILVSFTRISDGAVVFQVRNTAGTVIGSRFVPAIGFNSHYFTGISNGTVQQVFVGFVRDSDGAAVYQVWDPLGPLVSPVGTAFVTGPGFQVAQWLTGNFDGVANGEEVLVGFLRLSDGAIGYKQYTRAGGTLNSSRFILPGTYFNPSFLGLQPQSSARDDLLVGVTSAGGQPLIQLWNTNGAGSAILSKLIFNSDVK